MFIALDIRKLACKLICELVYKNENNQNKLCEIFDFSPISGGVTLNNTLPNELKKQSQSNLF